MSNLSRRAFLERSVLVPPLAWLLRGELFAQEPGAVQTGAKIGLRPAQVLLDMVHNNPGDAPYVTHYNDPLFVKQLGYKGKVYELFESAQFGIDWAKIDSGIFPPGSTERQWVNAKGAALDQVYSAAQKAGLEVFCHTDMMIFPKTLIEKYKLDYKNISNPETQKYVRLLVQQIFERFPNLDGLVIRIGETYLQGAPYHKGGVANRTDPQKTILPLMRILREEVCEKMGKKVLFRAWGSFDSSLPVYQAVSDGLEPHPKFYVVVKHCEGDFHRGNSFSKVLGVGRHLQIVEVQCSREYEGKGAYPNYIANGVIEGFEEHKGPGQEQNGQSLRELGHSPIIAGMFTWTRGGGWKGPYITNEFWPDLNAYVLINWAQTPDRSEEEIFNEYATKVLGLASTDVPLFRELCLLSAQAVLRGKRSTNVHDISPWWSRDQYMEKPPMPGDPAKRARVLASKDEAVQMWTQIVELSGKIRFSKPETQEFVSVSCQYGLRLYQIYREGFYLASLDPEKEQDTIKTRLTAYDEAWRLYRQLPIDHPTCPTLYQDVAFQEKPGIGAFVADLKRKVGFAG